MTPHLDLENLLDQDLRMIQILFSCKSASSPHKRFLGWMLAVTVDRDRGALMEFAAQVYFAVTGRRSVQGPAQKSRSNQSFRVFSVHCFFTIYAASG